MVAVADDDATNPVHEHFGAEHAPILNMSEMAASFAIDYKALLDGCRQSDDLRKRKKAMSVMLWLSAFGGFGGELGDEHAFAIGRIMGQIGDDSMARLVVDQPEVLRVAAGREVAYAFNLFEPDAGEREVAEFARRFPKTFKVLEIKAIVDEGNAVPAEQGDAVQPATAAEPKAESKEKPKPGSEGRSQ